jgi:hypothetical protein
LPRSDRWEINHHAGRSWGKRGETPIVAATGAREESADKMRLEPAGLRALHFFANGLDGVWIHPLRRQLALGDELLNRIDIDGAIHLAEEFGLFLWPITVADRIDQQVAQRVALEESPYTS